MANPNKTPAIVTILVSNRDKLLKYLGDFHTDKGAPVLAICNAMRAKIKGTLSIPFQVLFVCDGGFTLM